MKRFEFRENPSADAFVVFEGHEETPFWNRGGKIHFCHTDLTLAKARASALAGVVQQQEIDGDETFEAWNAAASETHREHQQSARTCV